MLDRTQGGNKEAPHPRARGAGRTPRLVRESVALDRGGKAAEPVPVEEDPGAVRVLAVANRDRSRRGDHLDAVVSLIAAVRGLVPCCLAEVHAPLAFLCIARDS